MSLKSLHSYPLTRHYFVDEAGDPNLFARRGRVIVGQEGCSQYFILGVADVIDPVALTQTLENLRLQLLADSYFKKIPSMQVQNRKTALAFHAKDDLPEVRREVYAVINKHPLRFWGVVRNKLKIVEYVHQRNREDPAYRYHPNELYDTMIRTLFKNLLHKDDCYEIFFSKRWKQDRTEALRISLERARQRFSVQSGISSNAQVSVFAASPVEHGSLQVVDYLLWALQRFYERQEERYLDFIWPSVAMVHDVDDTRTTRYGVYYTQKKPLTLAAFENISPGI